MKNIASMKEYLPHIDGLRALAVLSVVLFHAFPQNLPGGFLGVDIFFVISGYLITSILTRQIIAGDLSLINFFSNRVRRLFPALIAVTCCCLVAGFFTLFLDEYAQLGLHIASASAFVINFILAGEIQYFGNQAELTPMLHLWSLSIEEQFYLVWPVLILLVHLLGGRVRFWVSGLLVLAWATSIYLSTLDFFQNFYHPLGRCWELLCGAALASLHVSDRTKEGLEVTPRRGPAAKLESILGKGRLAEVYPNVFSTVGFLMIVLGLFLPLSLFGLKWYLVSSTTFLMLPVLGTVAIIAAGQNAYWNKIILSNPVATAIGKISYPLYLWHWPLFSFYAISAGGDNSQESKLFLIGLSFFLAFLTYRFVERPFRQGVPSSRGTLALLLTLGFVGTLAFTVHLSGGMIERYNMFTKSEVEKKTLLKISQGWDFSGYPQPQNMFSDPETGLRRIGVNGDEKVLLIGDSHMEQYFNSFDHLGGEDDTGQKSVLFKSVPFPPDIKEIKHHLDGAIDSVALSYFWAWRYGAPSVNQKVRCCGGHNQSVNEITIPEKSASEMDKIDEQLIEFVKNVQQLGKDVWIVLDNPFGEEFSARLMLNRNGLRIRLDLELGVDRQVVLERHEPVRGRLLSLAGSNQVKLIDPIESMCSPTFCAAFSDNGELLYKDYDHLSIYSARTLGKYVAQIVQN